MDAANNSQLPALLPPAAFVLRRTQTTLGLLRDVVQESSTEYWFERGRTAEAEDQWAEAAYAYRQCIECDAERWRARVRLAGALGHLGQAEAAACALTEASEVTVEGWQALAEELAELTWHRLRDCLEVARSATQDGFGLLLGLALVYRALKQGEKARQMLDVMQVAYQQQVAGSAQWFHLSGNLYSDEECEFSSGGDFSRDGHESIIEYNKAIELQPDYFSAYLHRGLKKSWLGVRDYHGAIADYNRVIELKPNCAAAYCNRGLAKYDLHAYWDPTNEDEDYTGAIADFDRAIELEPNYAAAYCSRGIAKSHVKKDYAGAIADFDRAIELKPNDDEGHFERGSAKSSLKDYAGAVVDYNKAIELCPNYIFAYFYRGLAKDSLQDYVGAVADYNHTIALGLQDEVIYEYRADAKERIGDIAGAAADRKVALAIQLRDSNEWS